ncbi:hypothetical protein S7335_588 [Synechococcus sp. PCC 7335]|uniref:hypothetical protein n=1 Tax=Synechococcus sp. (strain ATCC 29403 / PCC 7335) TaxID=91464 RepID=UPI00017EB8F7|nr:hypothetical protein [Synechococcus sp. PCC 7335]EDX83408.1 hypothetical protein S7335_588 [Synechococcus sp. PCC 7335]
MREATKLSAQQWQKVSQRASHFHDKVTCRALKHGSQNFFVTLFAIAAELIAEDADKFYNRAQEVFEEIEAFGQEPRLDNDWLAEVTGEKDTFYFSTDSLVTQVDPLPRSARKRRLSTPNEDEVVLAVEDAIQSAEAAITVAHTENSRDWIQRITTVLCEQTQNQAMTFALLLESTQLAPIELWLGLLLGHDRWLLQQECFYGEVSVRLRTP